MRIILTSIRKKKVRLRRSPGQSVLSRLVFAGILGLQGCAVHYYDPKTGAEHVWGFGHMTMKASAPQEGHQAVVRGTNFCGIAAGLADEGAYLSLGWDNRRRLEIFGQNTAIGLEWPNSDFLNVRVGSTPPHLP